MKKLTLILGMIVITLTINAQWYATQYGVTNMNELTKPQLNLAFDQGMKLKKAGVITTVISGAMLVVGSVMYSSGLNDIVSSSTYNGIESGVSKGTNGAMLMYAGGLGVCVGIPIWIVGVQRVNTVNIHLAKFDQLGYMIGFSLKF